MSKGKSNLPLIRLLVLTNIITVIISITYYNQKQEVKNDFYNKIFQYDKLNAEHNSLVIKYSEVSKEKSNLYWENFNLRRNSRSNFYSSNKRKYNSYKRRDENDYKIRVGAWCCDGTRSYSTGRGTCSWHGGVCEWIYSH